jgi:hypothetical protein
MTIEELQHVKELGPYVANTSLSYEELRFLLERQR